MDASARQAMICTPEQRGFGRTKIAVALNEQEQPHA